MKKLITFLILISLITFSHAGVEFDESDDAINCGSDSTLDNMSPLTFAAWVNISSSHTVSNRYFAKRTGTPGDQAKNMFTESGDTIGSRIEYDDGSSIDLLTTTTFSRDVWEHIVFVWDGTFEAAGDGIFLNGTEASYATETDASDTGTDSDAGGSFYIGNRPEKSRPSGAIYDEVYVWEAALTDNEIALLASSRVRGVGLQIQPSALRGYWPLDDHPEGTDTDGLTFLDMSGNGNTCTAEDDDNSNTMLSKGGAVSSYQQ
jgi:hypothetical protein